MGQDGLGILFGIAPKFGLVSAATQTMESIRLRSTNSWLLRFRLMNEQTVSSASGGQIGRGDYIRPPRVFGLKFNEKRGGARGSESQRNY